MVANACPTSNIESSDSVGCQFPWITKSASATYQTETEETSGAAAATAATTAIASTAAATAISEAVATAAFAIANVGYVASWTLVAAS